ncbi:MAG: hypothetical protein WC756_15160 [Taibaiella sp.]|jgi:hypothetical protein
MNRSGNKSIHRLLIEQVEMGKQQKRIPNQKKKYTQQGTFHGSWFIDKNPYFFSICIENLSGIFVSVKS